MLSQPDLALDGAVRKLERAKKHLGDLDALISEYLSRNPYSLLLEQQDEGKSILVTLSMKETPDFRTWALIAGDVVHNLRSSLDLIICDLATLEGKKCRYTAFPIFKDAEEFSKKSKGKLVGVHPKAVAIIQKLKPHGGGNDSFYYLSMLDNIDKHRLLIPTFLTPDQAQFSVTVIGDETIRKIDLHPLNPPKFEDGAKLCLIQPSNGRIAPSVNVDNNFTFKITLGGVDGLEKIEILELFTDLVDLVEKVIEIFKKFIPAQYPHLPRVPST